MTRTLHVRLTWFVAGLLLILSADWLALRLAAGGDQRMVAYGVLFDAALTIPLLYYVLVIRRRGKTWRAALPIVGVCLIAAWLILPTEQHSAVWMVEALLVPLELAFVLAELRLLWQVMMAYRQEKMHQHDAAEALRHVIGSKLGSGTIPSLLKHDAVAYYYTFFSWRRKAPDAKTENGTAVFTYGEGRHTMAAVFISLLALDGIALHVLLGMWSHLAAWICTASHLIFIAYIIGDCRASGFQRIQIVDGVLRIRYGLKLQADVPLDVIASVQAAMEFRPDKTERRMAAQAAASMQPANIAIALKEKHKVEGLLFLPRQVDRIYMVMDRPQAFERALREQIR